MIKIVIVFAISALVPSFQQNPVSYMEFPMLNDAYLTFDMQLSIKPEATDGEYIIVSFEKK